MSADLSIHTISRAGASLWGAATNPDPRFTIFRTTATLSSTVPEDLFIDLPITVIVSSITELLSGERRVTAPPGVLLTDLLAKTALCLTFSLAVLLTVITAIVDKIITIFINAVPADLSSRSRRRTAPPLISKAALYSRPTLSLTGSLLTIAAASTLLIYISITVVVFSIPTYLVLLSLRCTTGTQDTKGQIVDTSTPLNPLSAAALTGLLLTQIALFAEAVTL